MTTPPRVKKIHLNIYENRMNQKKKKVRPKNRPAPIKIKVSTGGVGDPFRSMKASKSGELAERKKQNFKLMGPDGFSLGGVSRGLKKSRTPKKGPETKLKEENRYHEKGPND